MAQLSRVPPRTVTLHLYDTVSCEPPHKITHPDKLAELYRDFARWGWGCLTRYPALVGYRWYDKIQLITGSHRYEAARLAGIHIPLVKVPFNRVYAAWGDLDAWAALIRLGSRWLADPTTPPQPTPARKTGDKIGGR